MERREFLQGVATALTLALTPTITGCATVGGPNLTALGAVDRRGLADRLRERLAAIRDATNLPNLAAFMAERGLDPALPTKMLATLWLTSTFRDLPHKVRQSPEIQQFVMEEVPTISQSLFEVADLLEGLDPGERAELEATLRDDPELRDTLARGFEGHGQHRGVEAERLKQMRDLTGHIAWRVEHQSASAALDDYLARLDRICRRRGIDRRDWRAGLARECAVWPALDVIADPDNAEVLAATDGLAVPETLDAVGGAGSHLGIRMQHRPGRRGVVVEGVHTGSPAEVAGLRSGDHIDAIDGQPLEARALVAYLTARPAHERVALAVTRGGERLDLDVALGAGPGDRIAIPRARAAFRGRHFRYMRSGLDAFGVGLIILGGGGGLFVLGLLVLLASGGLGDAAFGIGAVMTVGGVFIMAAGLVVMLIGGIIRASKGRRPPPPG